MLRRRLRSERGAALVELALSTPLLVVMIVGAVDFARAFYTAMELTNAARAGAQFASRSVTGFDAGTTQSVAAAASPQIATYTVDTPTQGCTCNTGATATAHSCTTACPAGQYLAVYITVTTRKAFSPVMRFPGVPSTVTIERTVTMRAQ
jgi:Flp pilus assembly protein TadG